MTQFTPGLIIETLLILLLVLTVSYCMILNRRLARLRSSQTELQVVIAELCAATRTAEQAIVGLRATTEEADQRLSDKLHKAQLLARELSGLTGGEAEAPPDNMPAPAPQVTAAPPRRPVLADAPRPVAVSTPAPAAGGVYAAADLNDWRHRTMSRLTRAS